MRQVIWSRSSLNDLRAIDRYLTQLDPRAASRILRLIRTRAALLERHPSAGPPTGDGYRQLTVQGTRYVLLYSLHTEGAEVLRVRHSMEDWRSSDPEES